MFYILISILVMALTILGITLFMMWLTDKAAGASLTERFKDAEYILNEHRVPEAWLSRPPLLTRLMQGDLFRRRPAGRGTKVQLLARLDGLITYFETAPFFESEEARELTLEQLRLERERWESNLLNAS